MASLAKPEAPRSYPSADSYIGSLISLTSRSEIRYEGLFCNINSEDSTIGLSNVRSFGTEGRKQDGPQVGPSDKVYEYILFRGSDIKDLKVISNAPVQAPTTAPVFNDPAIIQTHHHQAANPPASAQASSSGSIADLSGPPFQSNVHLYQPIGNPGPWAQTQLPSLPTTTYGNAVPPMFIPFPGYYGSSNGVQTQQQPLLTPPTLSLPMSSSIQNQQSLLAQPPPLPQQTQSSVVNFPSSQSLLTPPSCLPMPSTVDIPFSSGIAAPNLSQSSHLFQMPNFQHFPFPPQTTPSPMQHTAHHSSVSDTDSSRHKTLSNSPSASLPIPNFPSPSLSIGAFNFQSPVLPSQPSSVVSESPPTNLVSPLISYSNKPARVPDSDVSVKTSEPSKVSGSSNLITPGLFLQPGTSTASNEVAQASVHPLPQATQPSSHSSGLNTSQAQEPLLPLPSPADYKLHANATHRHSYPRHNNRGGFQRGRGNGMSRPVTRFTEEFDFNAMNEKFNKDEVWGDIGKSIKAQEDGHESQEEDEVISTKTESNPNYVKDDFFDSLSSNAQRRDSHNGRFNFSHQRKLDTETFGFAGRHNRGGRGGYYGPGRGGYGLGRGGRSGGGGYYGRGSGDGHGVRGRGHDFSGRGS